MHLKGVSSRDKPVDQYTVFERRVADKLDSYDWKLSLLADEDDFKFINNVNI